MSDFKGRHFGGEIVLWAALLQTDEGARWSGRITCSP